jgi:hypothetical protein
MAPSGGSGKIAELQNRSMNRVCQSIIQNACLLLVSTVALSQEQGQTRQTVRLKDSTRPALVKVNLMCGSIRVRGYSGKDITIEARPSDGSADNGTPAKGLKVEEDDNVVSVSAGPLAGAVNLGLQVPVRTSLKLACQQAGEIVVEQVEGEIEANGLNGSVTLADVSGVAVVHSFNGSIKVTLQRVTPDKPMSFSTLNGDIDVTLPANTRANVKLETLNASIHSDFEIQSDGATRPKAGTPSIWTTETQPDGRTRLKAVWTTEKVRSGAINGGGPEFQFKAFNGTIHLRKKGN